MQTQSQSAHMHTTGYFNMEALQATKVLAHYANTVEKHVLPSSNTTTRAIAQEEVVQNRYRGKYLRIILFSLYFKKYTFFTPYQYRKVDALRNAREVVQCYVPIEALKTNGNANRKHNKKGRILTLLAIACTSRPYPKGIVNSTTQDILHHYAGGGY